MKKKPSKSEQSPTPQPRRVLAEIPGGDFDTQLEQPSQKAYQLGTAPGEAPASMVQPEVQVLPPGAIASPGGASSAPIAGEGQLELPDGALVAMRRSGGLRFTSVKVLVYADGRVTVEGGAVPGLNEAALPRKLSDGELAALYRALDGAKLQDLPAEPQPQNPDAYAYELAARLASRTYAAQASEGSVPPSLAPLIQLLTQYMTRTEQ